MPRRKITQKMLEGRERAKEKRRKTHELKSRNAPRRDLDDCVDSLMGRLKAGEL